MDEKIDHYRYLRPLGHRYSRGWQPLQIFKLCETNFDCFISESAFISLTVGRGIEFPL